MGDALGAKVNADWVDKGVCEEVREREDKVCVGDTCDIGVLMQKKKNFGHVEPEE